MAFHVDGILLDGSSADPYYRKAIRTSMAATLQLPWARAVDWVETLKRFRAEGFAIASLTPEPGSTTIQEFSSRMNSNDRLMVVLGAEGSGLSTASVSVADECVRIPIEPAVDSLNVVVAAGIALDRLR